MTGSMMAAFPLGLALAALLAYFIIPTYGWRTVFIIGVVPAVLLFFVRMVMPESVRYLISRGRLTEAEKTVAEIEAKLRAERHCRRRSWSLPVLKSAASPCLSCSRQSAVSVPSCYG